MNKTKILEEHMIINSLDYPRQKASNVNSVINPNLTQEDVFAAKEEAYAQMARAKSTKQLNTDNLRNSMYCDNNKDNKAAAYGGGAASQSAASRPMLDKAARLAKSTNLDISSSTLCSSSR